ncbi:hypothetical protein SH668x_003007 [Planctomicrobium sp. SH668]|uniref:hypothetical protein n=1 Tax=Planctomicrobium sp. SH668 TaxID=3448126 RepID=UPI003F5BAA51
MSRRSHLIVALAFGVSITPGCSGLFTKRAIERFSQSMEAQDLDKLKVSTSDSFGQRALRQDDSAKGLKLLKLPVGKVEIISVTEMGDGRRKAIVKVGEKEKAKELEYILVKDTTGKGWVVDDVIMIQDSGNGEIVERSVTEQMDLLLTCREMLISWRGKEMEEKLAYCDPSMKATLTPLPAEWLNQMFKEIAGPGTQSSFKPEARLKGDAATVVVPHPQGNLFLSMKLRDDKWMLSDLGIEPKSKESTGIRSLNNMVTALDQSAKFLKAYQGEDRAALETFSTKHFFTNCLSGAEYSEISLPVEELIAGGYEARQYTDGTNSIKRVELLLNHNSETFMLTLREEELPKDEAGRSKTEMRVDEVTIFEQGSKDVKRMSSVFLSHAIVHAYLDALIQRNCQRLREISSTDFNDRVWNRAESSHFAVMRDPHLEKADPEIISTNFRGDVSEVTLILGETPMTLVLNQANGWMVVDDVLLPALDRPTSLKTNLEAFLTVHAFATSVHKRDMNGLLRFSADGLDRIVWRQLAEVPDLTQQVVRPLLSEVVSLDVQDTMTTVKTSNGDVIAEVKLVREGTSYVVHDVCLTSASDSQQQFYLLQSLRQMIAAGQLGPANKKTGQIVPVKGVMPNFSQVKHADFEPIEPEVYSTNQVE